MPESVAGKMVVGVEDKHVVGGALVCNGSIWTFRETEISRAIDWLRVNGWVPTNSIMAEMLPHGSGFGAGIEDTRIDFSDRHGNR